MDFWVSTCVERYPQKTDFLGRKTVLQKSTRLTFRKLSFRYLTKFLGSKRLKQKTYSTYTELTEQALFRNYCRRAIRHQKRKFQISSSTLLILSAKANTDWYRYRTKQQNLVIYGHINRAELLHIKTYVFALLKPLTTQILSSRFPFQTVCQRPASKMATTAWQHAHRNFWQNTTKHDTDKITNNNKQ